MEKVNPYNQSNKLINQNDIINIMETLNINDLKINNVLLYQRSFIHKSYCNDLYKDTDFKNIDESLPLQDISYETMEFLGDSILGSIVSSYLYERFYKIYNQNEGFLTYLKNRIVCGESLAHLSNKLGFNRYIVISKHIEDNCDGRNNKNILEDVFEAFIGAIYLDNDYDFTKNIILTIIEKYVDFTDIIIKNNNYKEQIIKYLQHNYKENPTFKVILDENDDKVYNCIMYFQGDIISYGTGKSKKKAEQDSAKNGLIHFKVLTD
jgi:ribonuclease III